MIISITYGIRFRVRGSENTVLHGVYEQGWLWILSCLGIVAFPPSVLFVSEYLIVKTMLKVNFKKEEKKFINIVKNLVIIKKMMM